jgi:hypothetical protein
MERNDLSSVSATESRYVPLATTREWRCSLSVGRSWYNLWAFCCRRMQGTHSKARLTVCRCMACMADVC